MGYLRLPSRYGARGAVRTVVASLRRETAKACDSKRGSWATHGEDAAVTRRLVVAVGDVSADVIETRDDVIDAGGDDDIRSRRAVLFATADVQ